MISTGNLSQPEPALHAAADGSASGSPAALLAARCRACLETAAARGIRDLDFPAGSAEALGCTVGQAATAGLKAIMEFLWTHELPRTVRVVCPSEEDAAIWRRTYNFWYAGTKDERL